MLFRGSYAVQTLLYVEVTVYAGGRDFKSSESVVQDIVKRQNLLKTDHLVFTSLTVAVVNYTYRKKTDASSLIQLT